MFGWHGSDDNNSGFTKKDREVLKEILVIVKNLGGAFGSDLTVVRDHLAAEVERLKAIGKVP